MGLPVQSNRVEGAEESIPRVTREEVKAALVALDAAGYDIKAGAKEISETTLTINHEVLSVLSSQLLSKALTAFISSTDTQYGARVTPAMLMKEAQYIHDRTRKAIDPGHYIGSIEHQDALIAAGIGWDSPKKLVELKVTGQQSTPIGMEDFHYAQSTSWREIDRIKGLDQPALPSGTPVGTPEEAINDLSHSHWDTEPINMEDVW